MSRTYEEMIGRAVTDADFRNRLLRDPDATLAAEGYEVAPEILLKLKNIDPSAAEAAARDIEAGIGVRTAAG